MLRAWVWPWYSPPVFPCNRNDLHVYWKLQGNDMLGCLMRQSVAPALSFWPPLFHFGTPFSSIPAWCLNTPRAAHPRFVYLFLWRHFWRAFKDPGTCAETVLAARRPWVHGAVYRGGRRREAQSAQSEEPGSLPGYHSVVIGRRTLQEYPWTTPGPLTRTTHKDQPGTTLKDHSRISHNRGKYFWY